MLLETRDELDRSNLYLYRRGLYFIEEIDDLASLYRNEASCLT